MEIIKAEVEEQKQETNDFLTNSDNVIHKTPPDPTLGTLEDKEIDSLSINTDDKQVQAPKEEKADFEELKVVNQEPDQLADFIVNSIPEKLIKSSGSRLLFPRLKKKSKSLRFPTLISSSGIDC